MTKEESMLEGQICLVTGANSGIGKATTKELARRGAKVIMVCRSEEKGRAALEELANEVGTTKLELLLCDFSSLEEVEKLVENFKKKYSRLDILINNHGTMQRRKKLTKEGFELTFIVNYLSVFYLTELLLDTIRNSSPAKIFSITSGAYKGTNKLPLPDVNFKKRLFMGFKAYSQSKLFLNMFTYSLAEQLRETEITVNCFSPGFTRTNISRHYKGINFMTALLPNMGRSPEEVAKEIMTFLFSPEFSKLSGKYFEDGKIVETTKLTYDKEQQQKLWEFSEELLRKHTT